MARQSPATSLRALSLSMPRLLRLLVALLLAALARAACTTSRVDARDAKGSGTQHVYDQPFDTVWNALMKSIKSTRLELVLDNKEKGIILGQGKVGPFTEGENVAIFVDDVGAGAKTRVEVVSKRAYTLNLTARNWETKIFDDLDKRLDVD